MRNKNVRLHSWPWQINLSFRARYRARKLRNLSNSARSDWHAFVPTDEHADASEGGGDVIEPAELRQRLQQQQPPGRHPGLVAGVDLVMPSKGNTGIGELFSLWEQNLMPQNPATLIWVQATQIFKKKKKKKECISENGRRNFLLHCAVLFLFCFTAVARGSSVRSLTSTTDRIKAHSLSLFWGVIITSSQAAGESSTEPQHQLQLVRTSCSASELPADGDTGLCLWSVIQSELAAAESKDESFCSSSSSTADVACVIAGG